MHKTLVVFLVGALVASSMIHIPAQVIRQEKNPALIGNDTIIEMIEQINTSLLYKYHQGLMKFGPRYTGSITCHLAAEYIYNEFEKMGLAVEYHEWRYAGFQGENVVATLSGSDLGSTAEYILCGHYDTVAGSPGANDDGSGTAAVLAIASVLRNYEFNQTIRFITFSGEEVGTYGSFCYARDAYFRGDNVIAVLNMDMIGYASTTEGGKVLRFFPPDRSLWMGDEASLISEKYNELLDMKVYTFPGYRGADNQAFVDYGYDGVWIAHQDGYPWGHSPDDSTEHLNWSYYLKATKLMCAITAEFVQKPIDVQIRLQRPYEGFTYFFKRPFHESSFAKKWFTGLRGTTIILGGKTVATAEVFSDEPVQYVVFCIDGYFMVWDSEPPYEWTIKGRYLPLNGRYILNVYAYTTSGVRAYDEMDIMIVSLAT
ncbi:MAG: M28 family peptidase [Candidatus Thermoplasmatota archaeon]|nr:M28 family peptidase [Candidatus Thermoplasmatota archaeon]